MQILEILKNIGLSPNEAKAYSAVLKLKKGLITPIAEKAGVNRTSAYDVLEYLNKKGLVLKYVENNKIGYTTEGPQKLKNWLTNKENQLDQEKEVFKEYLPELKNIFYQQEGKPKFRYFEGIDSMEDFFNDALDCKSGENTGYTSAYTNTRVASESFNKRYTKERVKRKIKARYFVQESDKEETLKYIKKYYEKYLDKNSDLIRVKVLPTGSEKYYINETAIYDNKFAIPHMSKDFFGVIIEDEQVANTQRMIFNVLWRSIKDEIKIV
ncbi:MAG: helix-turn-helix domain-containing protein [Patescibacteria group bacterium]